MTTIIVPFHQDERLPDDSLPASGVTVTPEFPAGELWPRLTALHSAVADNVAADIGAGGVPTVISGDCLVAMGVLAGTQRAGIDASLIWFDAHGDLHTQATSTSGYLGGMALRLALGADQAATALGLRPLTEDRAVLVDARDLDPAEADFLATSPLPRVPVDQAHTALPDGPLILHIDLDVIDPTDLTGLKFPAPNGPTTPTVLTAAHHILSTGRVVATHIACTWHPPQNPTETDARAKVLAEFTKHPTP